MEDFPGAEDKNQPANAGGVQSLTGEDTTG